jgi:hypothetical protein
MRAIISQSYGSAARAGVRRSVDALRLHLVDAGIADATGPDAGLGRRLGAVAGGLLGHAIGIRPAIVTMAAMLGVAAVIAWRSPLRGSVGWWHELPSWWRLPR